MVFRMERCHNVSIDEKEEIIMSLLQIKLVRVISLLVAASGAIFVWAGENTLTITYCDGTEQTVSLKQTATEISGIGTNSGSARNCVR